VELAQHLAGSAAPASGTAAVDGWSPADGSLRGLLSLAVQQYSDLVRAHYADAFAQQARRLRDSWRLADAGAQAAWAGETAALEEAAARAAAQRVAGFVRDVLPQLAALLAGPADC
jgi:hypothetical protein